jgi:hypothetical protein
MSAHYIAWKLAIKQAVPQISHVLYPAGRFTEL